jgi:hypothetical protein
MRFDAQAPSIRMGPYLSRCTNLQLKHLDIGYMYLYVCVCVPERGCHIALLGPCVCVCVYPALYYN